MSVQLHLGDCLTVMATLEANSVDSIVCDPPYGLSFMGKDWDHGVPGVAFWEAALRVAKPGAYLLAFGGTRRFHRLTVAIEDAGWEIRDCLMWLYGSGFPKGHSQLKPAWEPIIMARKPVIGTVADNVSVWGCGELAIDACRIELESDFARYRTVGTGKAGTHIYSGGWKGIGTDMGHPESVRHHPQGRWPANLILDESAAELLDQMSGECKTGGAGFTRRNTNSPVYSGPASSQDRATVGYEDTATGASRFFYCAKASRSDRGEGNSHPTVKPESLCRWLVRLVTPPDGTVLDPFAGSGSTLKAAILEGIDCVGIELDSEYLGIAQARCAHAALQAESQIDPQLPLLEVA